MQPTRFLSAGGNHTCAIAPPETYCWGANAQGQLGDNSTANHSSPVFVVSSRFSFDAVDAGGNHTCALAADKTAYCWGSNPFGQLGTGTVELSIPKPTQVRGGVVFESISLGSNHTCGVDINGQGYCWGLGDDGALGNDLLKRSSEPALVTLPK